MAAKVNVEAKFLHAIKKFTIKEEEEEEEKEVLVYLPLVNHYPLPLKICFPNKREEGTHKKKKKKRKKEKKMKFNINNKIQFSNVACGDTFERKTNKQTNKQTHKHMKQTNKQTNA